MRPRRAPESCPPGAVLLIGLGAQKAGTTWVYDYLRRHPGAHVPQCKEMHYFTGYFDPRRTPAVRARRDWLAQLERAPLQRLARTFGAAARYLPGGDDMPKISPGFLRGLVAMHADPDPEHRAYWRMLLRGWRGQRCVADLTPDYDLMTRPQLAELADTIPAARFLYILRDPVDRAWSNLRMHHRAEAARAGARGEAPPTLDTLLDAFLAGGLRHVLRRTEYHRVLADLEAAVPAERRLVLFYETLFTDAAMARLCGFAGIEARPGRYDRRIHGGGGPGAIRPDVEAALLRDLAPVYRAVRRRFGPALPPGWRDAP
jgi:hypothetical protein